MSADVAIRNILKNRAAIALGVAVFVLTTSLVLASRRSQEKVAATAAASAK
ncbi:MAG: hypothetical protein WCA16_08325 [Candidatus Sulfotelmatobacter sp.]